MAKTIVWNGPVGKTEGNEENLEIGSAKIAKGIVESGAYTVVGGGDTISYLKKIGLLDKFSFVSTGGGDARIPKQRKTTPELRFFVNKLPTRSDVGHGAFIVSRIALLLILLV